MKVNKVLNEMIDYIEENLEENIDYKILSKIMCVNENTIKKLFSFLCDCSIADYIRKRRLTKAGADLLNREIYSNGSCSKISI